MCTVRTTGCCAVLELTDISRAKTPLEMLRQLVPQIAIKTLDFSGEKPFIYYTGVVNRARYIPAHEDRVDDYGQALTDYIKEQKLGSVIETLEPRQNSTGNMVKIWLWHPDYTAIKSWRDKYITPVPHIEATYNINGQDLIEIAARQYTRIQRTLNYSESAAYRELTRRR